MGEAGGPPPFPSADGATFPETGATQNQCITERDVSEPQGKHFLPPTSGLRFLPNLPRDSISTYLLGLELARS